MSHSSSRSIAKYVAVGHYGEQPGYAAYVTDEERFRGFRLPDGWRWCRSELDPWELRQSGGSKIVTRVVERGFTVVMRSRVGGPSSGAQTIRPHRSKTPIGSRS